MKGSWAAKAWEPTRHHSSRTSPQRASNTSQHNMGRAGRQVAAATARPLPRHELCGSAEVCRGQAGRLTTTVAASRLPLCGSVEACRGQAGMSCSCRASSTSWPEVLFWGRQALADCIATTGPPTQACRLGQAAHREVGSAVLTGAGVGGVHQLCAHVPALKGGQHQHLGQPQARRLGEAPQAVGGGKAHLTGTGDTPERRARREAAGRLLWVLCAPLQQPVTSSPAVGGCC